MLSSHEPGEYRNRNVIRALLTLTVVVVLMLVATTAAFAQADPGAGSVAPSPTEPVPLDKLCVSGLVINHAEQPLEGWTVTATYEGTMGPHPPMTAVSDKDGKFSFEFPGPGRWALEIEVPNGWEPVTSTRLAVHVGYGNDDCVEVRFKVRETVEVVVIKIDDNHVPQPGWIISAKPDHGNEFGAPQTQTTGDDGKATFVLTPGPWIFTESPPDAVMWWWPISPKMGAQRLTVMGPGPITIRFKNYIELKPKGCINVLKYDVPPDPGQASFGLAGWGIEIVRTDGTLARYGETDAFGEVSFGDLPYGPYTVREVMQPGWVPDSPTSFSVVLTSQDDSCTDIIFYNKQLPRGYCITGRKLDENGMVGIPDWEIIATPEDEGGFVPDPVLTDGAGRYIICFPLEDYRIPGSEYTVSEVIPDGWTAVSPTEVLVTLPHHPDIPVVAPDFVNKQTRYEHPPKETDKPTHPPSGSDGCRTTHYVKPGEGVYKVASQYGVSGSSIFRANPWIYKQRNHWLYVGQSVCIP